MKEHNYAHAIIFVISYLCYDLCVKEVVIPVIGLGGLY